MNVTIDDIDVAEGAMKNLRVKLQAIGREIYQMREGEELGPQYGFDCYIRSNFAGSNYMDQEGPDWGVGTPILSLRYYWPRGEDTLAVTMPLGWIEQDWRALEQARLDEERAAETERKNAADETAARLREERDIKEYARLSAKFQQKGAGR